MRRRKGMPLGELYTSGKNKMRQSGIENPELEASLLLSKVLSIKAADIYAHPEGEVKPEKAEEFDRLIQRRIKREPVAYILGEKEFYSRSFVVTPDVLIPRPETEILVEEALKTMSGITSPSVIDIGTGSGCISVSVGCGREDAQVFATDISFGALTVAKLNAKKHGIVQRVSFVCADLLTCFKEESFDLVLSNPPYIAQGDFSKLEPDIRDFEPRVSLLGGESGLDFVRKIISGAGRVLKNGGWCIIEIGTGQSRAASKMFEGAGFRDVSTVKDLGGIERVVKGRWTR